MAFVWILRNTGLVCSIAKCLPLVCMRWLRDFRITGSESEQGSLLQALGNFTHSVLDRGVAVEEISGGGWLDIA